MAFENFPECLSIKQLHKQNCARTGLHRTSIVQVLVEQAWCAQDTNGELQACVKVSNGPEVFNT